MSVVFAFVFFNRGEEGIRGRGWTKSWNRKREWRRAVLLCPNRMCRLTPKKSNPCVESTAGDGRAECPSSANSTFVKCCLRLQLWHHFLCSHSLIGIMGQKHFSIGREMKCSSSGQLTVGLDVFSHRSQPRWYTYNHNLSISLQISKIVLILHPRWRFWRNPPAP